MRLDKYLKASRLIKRRTVANEACDAKRIMVNGAPQRASYDVKVGDKISFFMGERETSVLVTSLSESPRKQEAALMYKNI